MKLFIVPFLCWNLTFTLWFYTSSIIDKWVFPLKIKVVKAFTSMHLEVEPTTLKKPISIHPYIDHSDSHAECN